MDLGRSGVLVAMMVAMYGLASTYYRRVRQAVGLQTSLRPRGRASRRGLRHAGGVVVAASVVAPVADHRRGDRRPAADPLADGLQALLAAILDGKVAVITGRVEVSAGVRRCCFRSRGRPGVRQRPGWRWDGSGAVPGGFTGGGGDPPPAVRPCPISMTSPSPRAPGLPPTCLGNVGPSGRRRQQRGDPSRSDGLQHAGRGLGRRHEGPPSWSLPRDAGRVRPLEGSGEGRGSRAASDRQYVLDLGHPRQRRPVELRRRKSRHRCFLHHLAMEMRRYRVTVNAIAPGARTRMTEKTFGELKVRGRVSSTPCAGERGPDGRVPRQRPRLSITGQGLLRAGGLVQLYQGWMPVSEIEGIDGLVELAGRMEELFGDRSTEYSPARSPLRMITGIDGGAPSSVDGAGSREGLMPTTYISG